MSTALFYSVRENVLISAALFRSSMDFSNPRWPLTAVSVDARTYAALFPCLLPWKFTGGSECLISQVCGAQKHINIGWMFLWHPANSFNNYFREQWALPKSLAQERPCQSEQMLCCNNETGIAHIAEKSLALRANQSLLKPPLPPLPCIYHQVCILTSLHPKTTL